MITRWRMLQRPDGDHDPPHPQVREALGLWVLGTLWTLGVLGLALRGERGVVPLVLGGGLLAIWGWRSDGWLRVFPAATLLALAADRFRPPGREGSSAYLELLVAGVALVAIARFVGIAGAKRPNVDGAVPPGLLPLPVAAGVVAALVLTPGPMTEWVRPFAIGLALFFAARASSRLGGRPWSWAVFSLATLFGLWSLTADVPAGLVPSPGAVVPPLLALSTGLLTGLPLSRREERGS